MGQLFVYTPDEEWKGGVPYIRTSTGYKPANFLYRYDGSDWDLIWQRDTTPPAKPTVTATIKSGTKKTVVVKVSATGGPLNRVVVKVTTGTTWPSSPTDSTGYVSQESGGLAWSEFVAPGTLPTSISNVTKEYPPSGVTLGYSTKVNVSVWAQDNSFNWSQVATATVTTLADDPPPPVLQTFTAYLTCSSSRSYNTGLGLWPSDTGTYVYQAGERNYRGLWFYGTSIAATLAGYNAVTGLEIYVQRVNTAHGVNGAANVRIGTHSYTSQPSGAPTIVNLVIPGTLNRGEGKWFNMASWWSQAYYALGTGQWRGFGLQYQTTSYSSPYYMYAYGVGTNSGKIKLTWNKYV